MKTAEEYIETVYGTANLARAIYLQDSQSIIDLIQDYGDYLAKEVAQQALKDQQAKLIASGLNNDFDVLACEVEIKLP